VSSQTTEPPIYIAVVGSGTADARLEALAEALGREIALAGAVLVCGGLGGVMEAACRGARSAGGRTLGILPGESRDGQNPHLDLSIVTGMGHARNALVARSADAVIALRGGPGTLSEIALAIKMGRPVVGLGAWSELPGVLVEQEPSAALGHALERLAVSRG
jgi:uncharacterized protein (TIGR00725 family)